MKLFLDTNVLLDLLLEREGYEKAVPVFQLQEEGKLSLCVSILTMVNVAYVYRKTVGQRLAVVNLRYLSSLLEVLPMDGPMLQQAIYREGPDFEDILQAVCAVSGGCDTLITHNPKHFNILPGLMQDWVLPRILAPEDYV